MYGKNNLLNELYVERKMTSKLVLEKFIDNKEEENFNNFDSKKFNLSEILLGISMLIYNILLVIQTITILNSYTILGIFIIFSISDFIIFVVLIRSHVNSYTRKITKFGKFIFNVSFYFIFFIIVLVNDSEETSLLLSRNLLYQLFFLYAQYLIFVRQTSKLLYCFVLTGFFFLFILATFTTNTLFLSFENNVDIKLYHICNSLTDYNSKIENKNLSVFDIDYIKSQIMSNNFSYINNLDFDFLNLNVINNNSTDSSSNRISIDVNSNSNESFIDNSNTTQENYFVNITLVNISTSLEEFYYSKDNNIARKITYYKAKTNRNNNTNSTYNTNNSSYYYSLKLSNFYFNLANTNDNNLACYKYFYSDTVKTLFYNLPEYNFSISVKNSVLTFGSELFLIVLTIFIFSISDMLNDYRREIYLQYKKNELMLNYFDQLINNMQCQIVSISDDNVLYYNEAFKNSLIKNKCFDGMVDVSKENNQNNKFSKSQFKSIINVNHKIDNIIIDNNIVNNINTNNININNGNYNETQQSFKSGHDRKNNLIKSSAMMINLNKEDQVMSNLNNNNNNNNFNIHNNKNKLNSSTAMPSLFNSKDEELANEVILCYLNNFFYSCDKNNHICNSVNNIDLNNAYNKNLINKHSSNGKNSFNIKEKSNCNNLYLQSTNNFVDKITSSIKNLTLIKSNNSDKLDKPDKSDNKVEPKNVNANTNNSQRKETHLSLENHKLTNSQLILNNNLKTMKTNSEMNSKDIKHNINNNNTTPLITQDFSHFEYLGTFKLNTNHIYKVFIRRTHHKNNKTITDIMIDDITEVKNAEKATLETKLKHKFFSKMAHEFKTPLLVIKSLITEIKDPYNQNQNKNKIYKHINYLSDYISFLINDIITYANDDEIRVKIEKVSIKEIMKFAVGVSEALIAVMPGNKSQVKVRNIMDSSVSKFSVFSNTTRLKQIILNLVSNAVKFTKFGFIEISASFETRSNCCCSSLCVCENVEKSNLNNDIKINNIEDNDKDVDDDNNSAHSGNKLSKRENEVSHHNNRNNHIHSTHKHPSTKQLKKNLIISVKDSGIGISKENLQEIRNKQDERILINTDYEYNEMGTGLGIGIIKTLLKKLNHKLVIDSELGKGSCFKILIENIEEKTTSSLVNKFSSNFDKEYFYQNNNEFCLVNNNDMDNEKENSDQYSSDTELKAKMSDDNNDINLKQRIFNKRILNKLNNNNNTKIHRITSVQNIKINRINKNGSDTNSIENIDDSSSNNRRNRSNRSSSEDSIENTIKISQLNNNDKYNNNKYKFDINDSYFSNSEIDKTNRISNNNLYKLSNFFIHNSDSKNKSKKLKNKIRNLLSSFKTIDPMKLPSLLYQEKRLFTNLMINKEIESSYQPINSNINNSNVVDCLAYNNNELAGNKLFNIFNNYTYNINYSSNPNNCGKCEEKNELCERKTSCCVFRNSVHKKYYDISEDINEINDIKSNNNRNNKEKNNINNNIDNNFGKENDVNQDDTRKILRNNSINNNFISQSSKIEYLKSIFDNSENKEGNASNNKIVSKDIKINNNISKCKKCNECFEHKEENEEPSLLKLDQAMKTKNIEKIEDMIITYREKDINHKTINKEVQKKLDFDNISNKSKSKDKDIFHHKHKGSNKDHKIQHIISPCNDYSININDIHLKNNFSMNQIKISKIENNDNLPNFPTIGSRDKQILIVDDTETMKISIKRLLLTNPRTKDTYDIVEGSDGVCILNNIVNDQVKGNRIKIIITDENMEYMSGSSAISILRQLEEQRKIRSRVFIVSVTAFSDEDSVNNIFNKGADMVLQKPLSMKNLNTLLDSYEKTMSMID